MGWNPIGLATKKREAVPCLVNRLQRHTGPGGACPALFATSAGAEARCLPAALGAWPPLIPAPPSTCPLRALPQVGRNAVLMGQPPLERTLVSFGADTVVDSGAVVEGHYLEGLNFIYRPVRWGADED